MIICKELNRSFSTKEEMFKGLVESKADIISLKKSTQKEADGVFYHYKAKEAAKEGEEAPVLKLGDTVVVAMNTIGILDSHNDVHIAGIWNKSSKEQSGKTYHTVNHNLSLGSIVGFPGDVKIEVIPMLWSDLGKSYEGYTEVLVFRTTMTEKTNKDAFLAYRDGEALQHSIRMSYVGLFLCINDAEYKEEYSSWLKYYPHIANKEVADERGYFFAVTEAKIHKEGATVLFGSNDATPTLSNSTKDEPLPGTQSEPQQIDFSDAIKSIQFLN